MAASVAVANADRPLVATGGGWEFDGLLTLSGSYSTGGDDGSLAPIFAQHGQGTVDYVAPVATSGYIIRYSLTTNKWMVYVGDNAAGAAGPGVELAAGAYPAALTSGAFHVYARGR